MSISQRRRMLMKKRTLAPLPQEYQQVEYIENTSNAYIDTEYYLTSDDEIEAEIMLITNNSNAGIYGSRKSANEFNIGVVKSGSALVFNVDRTNSTYSTYRLTANIKKDQKYKVINKKTGRAVYDGDTLINSNTMMNIEEFVCDMSCTLFKQNGNTVQTSVFLGRFYTFRINGIMDLVPCYRKDDNVVGMFDLYSRRFLSSANSASFVAGGEV